MAQNMRVAYASSVTDAIEKFEDMDGNLAPATDLVAQIGGSGHTFIPAEFGDPF